jgi:flagellar hook-length control protein FliK
MQNTLTNSLNINGSAGANAPAPAAQRASQSGPNGGADVGQFSAMLSSEMEQRHASAAPAPAPAPAPKTEAPRPQAADQSAQSGNDAPAPAAGAAQPAQPAQANAGKDKKVAGDADQDAAADSDTAAAAAAQKDAPADPASAMLALMASLQPQAASPAAGKADGAAAAFDALSGNGRGLRGRRGDAAQLTALHGALKNTVAKDGGADGAFGKTFAAIGTPKNPALAAAGAALADDGKIPLKDAAATEGAVPSANPAADLHAALAGLKGDVRTAAGAADLALQAARDAAQAAPAQSNVIAAQLQPAALEAAQLAAGATETLSAQVGTNAWENQVGQKVVWMVGSEEQTASLTLNPPDLGPMQVVLSVTNDQASITFSSNQQEVRDALENAMPRLREMMSESGIALGNATVNAGMPDGRQAQQQQQDGNNGTRGNGGWNRGGRGEGGATAVETTVRPARTRALGDSGMVDTFA